MLNILSRESNFVEQARSHRHIAFHAKRAHDSLVHLPNAHRFGDAHTVPFVPPPTIRCGTFRLERVEWKYDMVQKPVSTRQLARKEKWLLTVLCIYPWHMLVHLVNLLQRYQRVPQSPRSIGTLGCRESILNFWFWILRSNFVFLASLFRLLVSQPHNACVTWKTVGTQS